MIVVYDIKAVNSSIVQNDNPPHTLEHVKVEEIGWCKGHASHDLKNTLTFKMEVEIRSIAHPEF